MLRYQQRPPLAERNPNQGTATDINIVSTLLPYCDAMFVDNKCRALFPTFPEITRYRMHATYFRQTLVGILFGT